MPEGPCGTARAWIARTWPLDYLMHRQGDAVVPVGRPFGSWLDAHPELSDPEAFEAWVWHDHYIWNSTRPRTRHGTVELRSACQQPPGETMAVAALSAGLVCGHGAIARRVHASLGDAAWPVLRAWHTEVVARGPLAPEPVIGLVEGILSDASEALEARGRGEAAFLAPLFARWASRTNPALRALAAWSDGGAEELVRRFAL
jgi:gamma-glutamylcysteine synthetase